MIILSLMAASAAECGDTVEYTHPSGSASDDRDCIEQGVCLTRDNEGPLFNAEDGTVEWACGGCSGATGFYSSADMNRRDLWMRMRDECFGGSNSNIPGSNTCLRIASTGNMYDVSWTSWDVGKAGGAGGFAYERTVYCPGREAPLETAPGTVEQPADTTPYILLAIVAAIVAAALVFLKKK